MKRQKSTAFRWAASMVRQSASSEVSCCCLCCEAGSSSPPPAAAATAGAAAAAGGASACAVAMADLIRVMEFEFVSHQTAEESLYDNKINTVYGKRGVRAMCAVCTAFWRVWLPAGVDEANILLCAASLVGEPSGAGAACSSHCSSMRRVGLYDAAKSWGVGW